MRDFTLAMTGEGPTERDFLLPLVARFIQERIVPSAEIFPKVWLDVDGKNDYQRILSFAQHVNGYSIAIYQFDADAQTVTDAWARRFKSNYERVKKQPDVHMSIVATIPKRSTNAWMLADVDVLLRALFLKQRPSTLDVLKEVEDAEKVDAKAILEATRRTTAKRHRRPLSFPALCARLADEVHFEQLRKLPSFQFFEARLQESIAPLLPG
jgi:hypothetical protein